MSSPNHDLIVAFYTAFQQADGRKMAACYHPQARFSDPVFDLDAQGAGAMWTMFCESSEDLDITFGAVQVRGDSGQAHWEAKYSFPGTGRPVHNRIDAQFRFREGRFIEHRDRFGFWAWSRMALGMPGLLLGWTPLLRRRVQATARARLEAFNNKQHRQ
jgi:ketosteroid isomerase-like protein